MKTRLRSCLAPAGCLGLAVIGALALNACFAESVGVTEDALSSSPLLPIDAGAHSDFMSSNSSTNFKVVDESPCNGNTDYVWTKTVGATDSYRVSLASVPDYALITEIRLTPCASRNYQGLKGGDPTFEAFYRWNGVDRSAAAPWSLPHQPVVVPVAMPAHVILTHIEKRSSSVLEIGVRLLTDPKTNGMRLSRLAATITYQESGGNVGGWGPGVGGGGY